jgi:hypothetical protein
VFVEETWYDEVKPMKPKNKVPRVMKRQSVQPENFRNLAFGGNVSMMMQEPLKREAPRELLEEFSSSTFGGNDVWVVGTSEA